MSKCKKCSGFTKFKNKLCKKCYWKKINGKKGGQKPPIKNSNFYIKYRKYIAPIGIVLLLVLMLLPKPVIEKTEIIYSEEGLIRELKDSFIFTDNLDLAFTIILIITLWFSYKYWLLRINLLRKAKIKLFRRKFSLIKYITLAVILVLILNKIKVDSLLGGFVNWPLFLIVLFLTLAGTIVILKFIDSINLRSDLACWGLRLIGGTIILFGILLLFSSGIVLFKTESKLVLNNILWIFSLCVILIGIFCQFRSARRHQMIGFWQ